VSVSVSPGMIGPVIGGVVVGGPGSFVGGGGAVFGVAVASVVESGPVGGYYAGVVVGVGVVAGVVRSCLAGVSVAAGTDRGRLPGVYRGANPAGDQRSRDDGSGFGGPVGSVGRRPGAGADLA